MQPQTGQYNSASLYSAGTIPDPSHPYAYTSSYGSAPPYTSYNEENASQNFSLPQSSLHAPSQTSVADSMALLSISKHGSSTLPSVNASAQGPYLSVPPLETVPPVQGSSFYTPSVPPYEQSYGTGFAPIQQGHPHRQSTSPQTTSYPYGRISDSTSASESHYDSLSTPFAGPSFPIQSTGYESSSSSSLAGSNELLSQNKTALNSCYAPPHVDPGSVYGSSSSNAHIYGADQHGLHVYDYLSTEHMGMFDQGSLMYGATAHGRGHERPTYGQEFLYDPAYYDNSNLHEKSPKTYAHDSDGLYVGDVYAYDGGNIEPYGARGIGTGGTRPAPDNHSPGNFNSFGSSGFSKLPKGIPKIDTDEKNGGVQKYRVKVLSDSSSSGPQDVLCQIGLDGVRMVSPSTGKTVRIYPLETITRWEVSEPSVFAFWSKSSVDIEPRRIQLQSSSYTTNSILDTLTAASVQFSEMVNKVEPSKTSTDGDKSADQDSDKKKSNFVNWMQLRTRQLAPEEKQHWVPDEAVTKCSACANQFGPFLRRHHCRNCGDVYCDKCTNGRTALTADEDAPVVRVCDHCLAEVTQRLSNAKEISSRPVPPPHTHEDLAKKLQEELERTSSKRPTMSSSVGRKERSGSTTVLNCSSCGSISLVDSGTTHCPTCGVDSSRSVGNAGRDGSSRGSSWSNSGDFNKHMQEVACPICTVHLQVQVPSSGTQTVECGVCQHPFLVGAHS